MNINSYVRFLASLSQFFSRLQKKSLGKDGIHSNMYCIKEQELLASGYYIRFLGLYY